MAPVFFLTGDSDTWASFGALIIAVVNQLSWWAVGGHSTGTFRSLEAFGQTSRISRDV